MLHQLAARAVITDYENGVLDDDRIQHQVELFLLLYALNGWSCIPECCITIDFLTVVGLVFGSSVLPSEQFVFFVCFFSEIIHFHPVFLIGSVLMREAEWLTANL